MKTLSKRHQIILLSTGLLLLIPLIAMQFTNEVNWSLMDFVVMGILLLSVGFIGNYIWENTLKGSSRIVFIIITIIIFFLIWAELAVGIFGTPFAGN